MHRTGFEIQHLPCLLLLTWCMSSSIRAEEVDYEKADETARQTLLELSHLFEHADANVERIVPLVRDALEDLPIESAGGDDANLQRARVMILRAEILAQAAALLPENNLRRRTFSEEAINLYQRVRLDYHRYEVGLFAIVGEAKLRRQLGQWNDAIEALEPITKNRTGRTIPARLVKLAEWELMEIMLRADLRQADRLLRVAERQPEQTEAELGQLGFYKARFRLATSSPDNGKLGDEAAIEIATLLRDANVAGFTDPYARMKLLAQIAAQSDAVSLVLHEVARWADMRFAKGHHAEAVSLYQQLANARDDALDSEQWARIMRFAAQQDDHAATIDASRRTLDFAQNEVIHIEAQRTLANALIAQFKAHANPTQSMLAETQSALLALAGSRADATTRVQALERWANLSLNRLSHEQVLETLASYTDSVERSPVLAYTTLYCQAAIAREESATRPSASAQTTEILRSVGANASQLAELIAQTDATNPLAAHAALLGIVSTIQPPVSDSRAGLAMITQHWSLLRASKNAAKPAATLRMHALLDQGLTQAALDFLSECNELGGTTSSQLRTLLDAASRRSTAMQATADERDQVVRLVNTVLKDVANDSQAFVAIAPNAVRALLHVGAHEDAKNLIDSLRRDASAASFQHDLILWDAEASQQRGELNEALAIIDSALKTNEANLQLRRKQGELLTLLKQPADAAQSYRLARQAVTPGSDAWWQVTIELCQVTRTARGDAAAEEILRVAVALYEPPADVTVLRSLQNLRSQIQPPTPKETTQP